MASKPRLYPNRTNQDVSHDSICLTCFATIGGVKSNGQFAQHDKTHVCDSAFLADRGILTGSKITSQSARVRPRAQAYSHSGEAA